mgnify:CR=1 FL=1
MAFYPNHQIKACDMNGRFESNELKVGLNIAHMEKTRHGPVKAVKQELQVDALPGAVVLESSLAGSSSGSVSAGVMVAIIICCASLFIILVAVGIYKLKR